MTDTERPVADLITQLQAMRGYHASVGARYPERGYSDDHGPLSARITQIKAELAARLGGEG